VPGKRFRQGRAETVFSQSPIEDKKSERLVRQFDLGFLGTADRYLFMAAVFDQFLQNPAAFQVMFNHQDFHCGDTAFPKHLAKPG
jgi:hypothetical protein